MLVTVVVKYEENLQTLYGLSSAEIAEEIKKLWVDYLHEDVTGLDDAVITITAED